MLPQIKVKVASPAISRAVQEELFKRGYKWTMNGDNVCHTDELYIFGYSNGTLTYGSDDYSFRGNGGTEMIATTESRLVVVGLVPVRDKVVVFGKTYYKDDVDAALAKLERATA
jgi:hypothetical protein